MTISKQLLAAGRARAHKQFQRTEQCRLLRREISRLHEVARFNAVDGDEFAFVEEYAGAIRRQAGLCSAYLYEAGWRDCLAFLTECSRNLP